MAELIAIEPRVLSFRRDGHWYADDERIANERLQLLFSRHVQADDDGGWVIDVGVDRQRVEVEDTPLVVRSVREGPDGGFRVWTNDRVESDLEPQTLHIGPGDVLYCTVDRGERGRLPARFLRPAYYHLAEYFEADGDEYVLNCGSGSVRIAAG